MNNGELMHHGIKGMKWGVRRTEAQLARARGETPSEKKEDSKPAAAKSQSSSKKKVSEMSDDELRQQISRLDLEKRYKDLMTQVNPPKSNEGRKYVVGILKRIGENTAVNLGSQATTHILGELINSLAGVKSDDPLHRVVNPQKGQSDKK